MAQKRQQPNRKKKTEANVPFDEELFATPTSAPEYSDIFASLLDFASEPEPMAFEPPLPRDPGRARRPRSLARFSNLQKVLLVGIIFVAAALAYTVLNKIELPSSPKASRPVPQPTKEHTPHQQAYTDSLIQPPLQSAPPVSSPPQTETILPGPEPLSLQIADKLYLAADFESALATYDKLFRRLPPSEDQQSLRDFLLLRMALCSKNAGNIQQADTMFRTVSLSRRPLLRALARYHQSGTLLTRSLLSLRDADTDLPAQLWAAHPDIDPFVNLDQPQLKVFLASGADKLDEALLSPQIRPTADDGRWSVICNGASIEELLARFATNTRFNLQWADNGQTALDEEGARRRPVYLYLPSATVQQVLTVAAGSVGLLARMDRAGNVTIVDPSSYASLAEHTERLADESVSLWRRFLMTAEDGKRVPSSHFSLGLLHTVRERPNDAIAEFKLVANRFANDDLAPYALLHSGQLKVTLRDYAGAQQDLKQLVELYPDTESADRASLHLADATMKAGMYIEATGLYRKVYNLGLSRDSQTESALGAGRCFYETRQYEDAAKWLNRYVTLADDHNRREYHVACLLLGKTYLALEKPRQAHAALKLAMKGDLSRQQYVETVATLVRTYVQQGLFLEALNILEGTHAWQLSQQEMIELLVLRARILRSIGLLEKAIAILGEKAQFLPSPELKGKVALELTECYYDQREFEKAREVLSETFALVEPGPLAQQIGRKLAAVCLRVGQPAQAVSVCSQLLEYTTDDIERRKIRALLASAYREQEEYDLAVSALLGNQMNQANAAPPPSAGAVTP